MKSKNEINCFQGYAARLLPVFLTADNIELINLHLHYSTGLHVSCESLELFATCHFERNKSRDEKGETIRR